LVKVRVLPAVVYVPSSVFEAPPKLSAQVQSPAVFELHDRETPASAPLVDVAIWAQVTPKLVRQLAGYVKSIDPDILVAALYVPPLVKVTVPLGWMWLDTISPGQVVDDVVPRFEQYAVILQVPTTEPPQGVKAPHVAVPPDEPSQPSSSARITKMDLRMRPPCRSANLPPHAANVPRAGEPRPSRGSRQRSKAPPRER
jgi:hypothetical protein